MSEPPRSTQGGENHQNANKITRYSGDAASTLVGSPSKTTPYIEATFNQLA